MGQSPADATIPFCAIFFLACVCGFLNLSCDRSTPSATSRPATASTTASAGVPRIASLVPAATDLLIAMGARDRLVAVSNFDQEADAAGLPRVGDYQQIDWERLAAVRPTVVIVQMRPDRMPPGLADRVASTGATLSNVSIETLADVFAVSDRLGNLAGESDAGSALSGRLRAGIDGVRQQVAGRPRPRTLLTVDVDPKSIVGRGSFLDELLTDAGGENVAPASLPHWPTLDAESLASLDPEVVIALLPGATPQVAKLARETLSRIAWPLPPRVFVLNQPTLLQPGAHVAELAQNLATLLHPGN